MFWRHLAAGFAAYWKSRIDPIPPSTGMTWQATVTATDLDGNEFTEEAEGLYARCLQHEYDHIEGTVIINRMSQTARIVHRRQLKKLTESQEGK